MGIRYKYIIFNWFSGIYKMKKNKTCKYCEASFVANDKKQEEKEACQECYLELGLNKKKEVKNE